MEMGRVVVSVHGVVQGVGYRWHVKTVAERHGITGFAKNMADGSVMVLADGPGAALKEFLKEINVDIEGGPQVFSIEEDKGAWAAFGGKSYESFEIDRAP